MFTHLLIPLDGSRLAETALPAAAALAERLQARVTLLHVIEDKAPPEIHGERHLTNTAEAERYLTEMATDWFPGGANVSAHVHAEGAASVAAAIVSHAIELEADLIILCTHGRSGLRHRLFGSIAQSVVGQGRIPVLLVPPGDRHRPPFACDRILLPLDTRTEHEESLPVGLALAKAWKASVHVLAVVPTLGTLSGERAATGTLLPGTTAALLDLEEDHAEEYLRARVAEIRGAGIPVTAEVCRGAPADVIVNTAKRVRADVIVLATHGKSGLGAFWAGSVAPKVSHHARVPLLLVAIVPTREPA